MPPQAGIPVARDLSVDYRRLLLTLASRASRLGSRDPESAAQEALRRSFENPKSQPAIEHYFGEQSPSLESPQWPLDQLLGWLHGVLQFVVREEHARAAFRREVTGAPLSDPADGSAGTLEKLVEREKRIIVEDCFSTLDREYQNVLKLRMDGMKYGEIARKLGVNENTVATWVSRGIRELGRRVRCRIGGMNE